MESTSESSWTDYEPLTEGRATILFPKSGEVFYNPVQQFNRDLSIAAIQTFQKQYVQEQRDRAERKKQNKLNALAAAAAKGEVAFTSKTDSNADANETPATANEEGITILEALSATGLRAIRYAKELTGVKHVIANDFSEDAVAAIRRNVMFNGLNPETQVLPSYNDASALMYLNRDPRTKYTVIDLDPYGSASPFIDAAVQAVTDGGMMLVTCTDMAILAGNHPETCFGKYGSLPLKSPYCHEMALRIVLHSIAQSAARYKRYIIPLVSLSIDFYARVFVRVFTSPAEVKRLASQTGTVYHCGGCESFHLQPLCIEQKRDKGNHFKPATGPPIGSKCDQCDHVFHVGGPIWLGSLHNHGFIDELLTTAAQMPHPLTTLPRIQGMLAVAKEELEHAPLYYSMHHLSKGVHASTPSLLQFRSALLSLGYEISSTHALPEGFKTNAPNAVVWDVMRSWASQSSVDPLKFKENSVARQILTKQSKITADFTVIDGANPLSRQTGVVRFQENPTSHWGPKARAKRARVDDDVEEAPAKRDAPEDK